MSGTAEIIKGRPDHGNPNFGQTWAKHFPPYVFSIQANSALVHRVSCVKLRWYAVGGRGEYLYRLNKPQMIAHCMCGMWFFLEGSKSRTCWVPNKEAMKCGRCLGNGPVFGRDFKDKPLRREAHVKLGCVVQGY